MTARGSPSVAVVDDAAAVHAFDPRMSSLQALHSLHPPVSSSIQYQAKITKMGRATPRDMVADYDPMLAKLRKQIKRSRNANRDDVRRQRAARIRAREEHDPRPLQESSSFHSSSSTE